MAFDNYGEFYDPCASHAFKHPTPRIKLFFGNTAGTRADQLFGEWIEENPRVRIIDYRYEHARYGDHSIAVFYEEEANETKDCD